MGEKLKRLWKGLSYGGGAILLGFLVLYMGGTLVPDKIGPDEKIRTPKSLPGPEHTVRATVERITEFYEGVGIVRPRREANIEAQVTGRITEIRVGPGDVVEKGDVLIVLDSRELRSRLDQAVEALRSAKARREQAAQALRAAGAVHEQAGSAFKRIKTYFDSEAATSHDLEEAESRYRQAQAGWKQAEDGLKGAEAGVSEAAKVVAQHRIVMGYARITASEQGEVVKRLAEPGDLAWPGKRLLLLQTRESLRLEALVPEGLIHQVVPGTSLRIVINALDRTLEGAVEEVVPAADPATRTFLVKVGLPRMEGLFPGMFGRLMVPVGERAVVLVPRSAVKRIGQLEVVTVEAEGRWQQIYVRTGRTEGKRVEILSGLKGGETLALDGGSDA